MNRIQLSLGIGAALLTLASVPAARAGSFVDHVRARTSTAGSGGAQQTGAASTSSSAVKPSTASVQTIPRRHETRKKRSAQTACFRSCARNLASQKKSCIDNSEIGPTNAREHQDIRYRCQQAAQFSYDSCRNACAQRR